jgi:hypothetical protein
MYDSAVRRVIHDAIVAQIGALGNVIRVATRRDADGRISLRRPYSPGENVIGYTTVTMPPSGAGNSSAFMATVTHFVTSESGMLVADGSATTWLR